MRRFIKNVFKKLDSKKVLGVVKAISFGVTIRVISKAIWEWFKGIL